MPLAITVTLLVVAVAAITGLAGYLIDKSADSDQRPESGKSKER